MDIDPTEFPSPFDAANETSNLKKFNVKFAREFEVQIEADSLGTAERLAKQIVAQFPAGTAKVSSIIPEGYVEHPGEPNTASLDERRNAGLALKVRELTDQDPLVA